MKLRQFLQLAYFGITTVLLGRKGPLMGSVILTDRCNLSCRHCAVGNITSVIYPYSQVKADLIKIHSEGIRILFLYGGEPFMWQENGRQWTCSRCIDVPGLCSRCGFFFAAKFSLVFSGHISVISDMLRTYLRYKGGWRCFSHHF